jgi:hypothetical protein
MKEVKNSTNMTAIQRRKKRAKKRERVVNEVEDS